MKYIKFLILCLVFVNLVQAQININQPKPFDVKMNINGLMVGERVPLEFWEKEHVFYIEGDTVRKNLMEYKGKLIILDFWASWCGACKSWFPITTKLEHQFKGNLKIMLVNSDTVYDNFQRIDKVLSDRDFFGGEKGASIIFDSYLKDMFPYKSIPRYVWIDPKGMIRAITTMDFLTSTQISTILNRKEFDLKLKEVADK